LVISHSAETLTLRSRSEIPEKSGNVVLGKDWEGH